MQPIVKVFHSCHNNVTNATPVSDSKVNNYVRSGLVQLSQNIM